MEDEKIIEMYRDRNHLAVDATQEKYGPMLQRLASRLVRTEDAEECVNDTYLSAWKSIPPEQPEHFPAWLARVCRNHAVSRIRYNSAGKRDGDPVEFSLEMEECLPGESVEHQWGSREIGLAISRFLRTLPEEKRNMFLRRYWFGDSVREVAEWFGCSEGKVRTSLHRVRQQLKKYLETEDIYL